MYQNCLGEKSRRRVRELQGWPNTQFWIKTQGTLCISSYPVVQVSQLSGGSWAMLSIVRAETTDNIIPREGHTQSLSQSSSFPVVGMGENKADMVWSVYFLPKLMRLLGNGATHRGGAVSRHKWHSPSNRDQHNEIPVGGRQNVPRSKAYVHILIKLSLYTYTLKFGSLLVFIYSDTIMFHRNLKWPYKNKRKWVKNEAQSCWPNDSSGKA